MRLQDDQLQTHHNLWTSLEGENPGGSIKDRMVFPELNSLRGVSEISEISAGSTALSLAYYSRLMNMRCQLFIPNTAEAHIKIKLLSLGAELTECEPDKAYALYDDFSRQSNAWSFKQMQRKELRQHYRQWAENQVISHLGAVDLVFGAVGTGHSLLGVAEGLKPKSGCIAIEPLANEHIHGIRNLNALSFGDSDPCDLSLINERMVVSLGDEFSMRRVGSSHGTLHISDSFRLTLKGALAYLKKFETPLNVFLIGSHCKRS